MNTQQQGQRPFYQLPPKPELTLNDLAPFIASSLQATNPNFSAAGLQASMTLARGGGGGGGGEPQQRRQFLKSVLKEALDLFDDEEEDDLFC